MADNLEAHPKIVWIVLGSGAAGGVVSWVYSITLGLPPFIASSALAILASIVLGSTAAYVSVFVLAHSDVRVARRVAGFALLSGFAWKPVLDGGLAFMNEQVGRETTRSVETAADLVAKRRDELREAPAGSRSDSAKALATETASLLALAPDLRDYALVNRIEDEARKSIELLSVSGAESPLAITKALGDIGFAAATHGMINISGRATAGVRDLTLSVNKPDVSKAALAQIARFGSSPRVSRPAGPWSFMGTEAAAEIAYKADPKALSRGRVTRIQIELANAAASLKVRGDTKRASYFIDLHKKLSVKIAKLPK